jgi:tetratricopeptide (TPR) repeat protein
MKIFRNIALFFFFFSTATLLSQSVADIDKRAQAYYEQKQFARAIAEWIRALEIDPDNVEIQQKIEIVYEKKREKDLAVQRSKKELREALEAIEKDDPEDGKDHADRAIDYFVTAYRIDPNDTDLIIMRDRLQRARNKASLEIERKRLNEQKQREYERLKKRVIVLMDEKKFEEAIPVWDKMLEVFPEDDYAAQGKRTANLAIQSRLRFEQIQRLLTNAKQLFDNEEYVNAQSEFSEVMKIDPGNPEATEYLTKIDGILEERVKLEQKRIQAERFYQSALRNTEEYQFDTAREEFESVIDLIENYKDAKSRLAELDDLERQYIEDMKQRNLRKINEEFQKGFLFLSQKDYRGAIGSFQAVLDIDPKNEQARKYIKTAKEALAEDKKDIVDVDSPYFDLVQSLIASGKKYYAEGEYEKSLKQWERILNLFPSNSVATENMLLCQFKINPSLYERFAKEQIEEGKELLEKRNFDRALRKFTIIKNISPDYPGIDELIADATPAEPVIIPQTASTPQPAPEAQRVPAAQIASRYQRAVQSYQSGNLQSALTDFRWVVQNDPQNVQAIININRIESQLRFSSGDSGSTASPQQNTLNAEQKALVRRYYFNGITYYSRNQFPEAIAEWRKVLAIDPNHAKAQNNIRKCLLLMQQ